MRANQVRLYLPALAFVALQAQWEHSPNDTGLDHAQCGTIRQKLFGIGGLIRVSVRHVVPCCPMAIVILIHTAHWEGCYPLRSVPA